MAEASNPAKKSWWRFTDEADMSRPDDGFSVSRETGDINAHRSFINDCIRSTRSAGNSGFCRAVAPFWNTRDRAFYINGMSGKDACAEGYKAMMVFYDVDAPEWAWWV